MCCLGLADVLHALHHGDTEIGGGLADGRTDSLKSLDLGSCSALTARDDGAGMTHTASWGRGDTGNEGHNRLVLRVVLLEPGGGVLLGGATNLTDHDDTFSAGVGNELLEAVDEIGSVEGIAADADNGGLAQALSGGLVHGLVSQGTGTGDNTDLTGFVDVTGHDADLALAGADDTRAIGSYQTADRLGFQRSLDANHILLRDTFGDADDEGNLSFDGFHNGGGGARRRHVDDTGIAVRLLLRFGGVFEHGKVEMGGARFLGVDATNHLGSVRDGLLCVERALLTGHTLANNLRVFINEHFGGGRETGGLLHAVGSGHGPGHVLCHLSETRHFDYFFTVLSVL